MSFHNKTAPNTIQSDGPLIRSITDVPQLVWITHIQTPEEFYIRFDKRNAQFDHLKRRINTYCDMPFSKRFTDIRGPQNDQFLLAYSPYKRIWGRCEFKGQSNNLNINVHFLDYGSNETVPLKNCRKITDDILNDNGSHSYCHRCSLINLKPYDSNHWKENSNKAFEHIGDEKRLTMFVENVGADGVMNCDLSYDDPHDCQIAHPSIVNYLVALGVAKYRMGPSQINRVNDDEFQNREVQYFD